MKNRDKYKSKKVTEYSKTKAATIKINQRLKIKEKRNKARDYYYNLYIWSSLYVWRYQDTILTTTRACVCVCVFFYSQNREILFYFKHLSKIILCDEIVLQFKYTMFFFWDLICLGNTLEYAYNLSSIYMYYPNSIVGNPQLIPIRSSLSITRGSNRL